MKHLIVLFFFLNALSVFSQNWKAEKIFLLDEVKPNKYSDLLYKANPHLMDSVWSVHPELRLEDFPAFREHIDHGSMTGFANNFASHSDTSIYGMRDWLYVGSLYFYEGTGTGRGGTERFQAQRNCFRKAYEVFAKSEQVSLEDAFTLLIALKANGDTLYYDALIKEFEFNRISYKWGRLRLLCPESIGLHLPYLVDSKKFKEIFSSLIILIKDEVGPAISFIEAKVDEGRKKNDEVENRYLELLDEDLRLCVELQKSKQLSQQQEEELTELFNMLSIAKANLQGDILRQAAAATSKDAPTASKDGNYLIYRSHDQKILPISGGGFLYSKDISPQFVGANQTT